MAQVLLREVKRHFIQGLKSRLRDCILLKDEAVKSSLLNPKEALGDPGLDDFPFRRGAEVLIWATI